MIDKLTVMVSGARGAGKTTLLNFMVEYMARKFTHIEISHRIEDHKLIVKNWKHRKGGK